MVSDCNMRLDAALVLLDALEPSDCPAAEVYTRFGATCLAFDRVVRVGSSLVGVFATGEAMVEDSRAATSFGSSVSDDWLSSLIDSGRFREDIASGDGEAVKSTTG